MSGAWPFPPPSIGKYTLGNTLGKGSFSLVKEAEDSETHKRYAIKLIPRTNSMTADGFVRFEREVRVIIHMNHPGVIKVFDFLSDADFLYLVLELVSRTTLLSQLSTVSRFSEDAARQIFKQLLVTVAYIHAQGVAHRDLKLENVVVDGAGHLKIVDFGFSRAARTPGELFASSCGSVVYAAPEIISHRKYDGRMADMWSMGVILYVLVTGVLPWRGSNELAVYGQIIGGDFEIPATVGVLCSDLIRKLMVKEPVARLTATEADGHPWLDGVKARWEEGEVKSVLSESTFIRLLNSSAPSLTAVRPGRALKARFGPPRAVSIDGKMRRFPGSGLAALRRGAFGDEGDV
jgi:serine/threonine protein kinase